MILMNPKTIHVRFCSSIVPGQSVATVRAVQSARSPRDNMARGTLCAFTCTSAGTQPYQQVGRDATQQALPEAHAARDCTRPYHAMGEDRVRAAHRRARTPHTTTPMRSTGRCYECCSPPPPTRGDVNSAVIMTFVWRFELIVYALHEHKHMRASVL